MVDNNIDYLKTVAKIQVLKDLKASGKERDWRSKKSRSLLMAEHFQQGGLKSKAERMHECADVLTFKLVEGKLRLSQTWFCKVRLCPMCNWRRSLKIAYQNKLIVETLNQREKVRWVFLTLTVRNCESEELKQTIDSMMEGFRRLFMYAKVKKIAKGYFRALEVTKNRKTDSEWSGTYHPHFHVLMAVPSSYFKKKEYYIAHSEWAQLWQKAMKLDYSPMVSVQAVKPKKEINAEGIENDVKRAIAEQNAILEVSKYPVKDSDILVSDQVTQDGIETVLTLDDALAYKRLIAYGGMLKDIHKELNLDDPEDGDMIHVDQENDEVANGAFEVMAYWNIGIKNYVLNI